LRIVLHIDRPVPEPARYDLSRAGRRAFEHALIAEKAEGHYADLAGILDGMRRRNRRHDGQRKSDERRSEPADPRLDPALVPRLGLHSGPRFVIATIADSANGIAEFGQPPFRRRL